jgi:hypothetical protein
MFRHSEIQQMIKAHNLAEDSDSPPAEIPAVKSIRKPVESEKPQKRKHQEPINGERNDVKKFTAEGEKRTYRRICRELDEQKKDHVELDY